MLTTSYKHSFFVATVYRIYDKTKKSKIYKVIAPNGNRANPDFIM